MSGKVTGDRLKGRVPGDAAEFLDGPGLSYTGGPRKEKLADGTTITVPAPDVFGEDGQKPPSKPAASK